MKFALAADHAGFQLKEDLGKDLQAMGHEVLDLGTHDPSMPSDYPDSADAAGTALVERKAERGIAEAAWGLSPQQVPGVRAGVCRDTYSARQGSTDDMNVLRGQRIPRTELAREVVTPSPPLVSRAKIATSAPRAESHRNGSCDELERVLAVRESFRFYQERDLGLDLYNGWPGVAQASRGGSGVVFLLTIFHVIPGAGVRPSSSAWASRSVTFVPRIRGTTSRPSGAHHPRHGRPTTCQRGARRRSSSGLATLAGGGKCLTGGVLGDGKKA